MTSPIPQAVWAAHAAARQARTHEVRRAPGTLTARDRSALRAQIWTAIKAGDVDGVRDALNEGADPTQYKAGDSLKIPPLFAAVQQKNLAMVEVLLAAGADVNQKSSMDASIGATVVSADEPAIADRLIAAGLRIGYPKVDPQDEKDHCMLVPSLMNSGEHGAARMKTWWLERGGQGLPGTVGATLPLSPPRRQRPTTSSDREMERYSVWGRWLHTAVNLQDAGLAAALRERVLNWSALENGGTDPREAWATLLHGPWNDAVINDDVARLEWLVQQRWTPPSLNNELDLAWSWVALTTNATNAYAWLIEVPGMRERMRENVIESPSLTLHRPLEKSSNPQARPFTGWTVPMLNRLVRAGVDVGTPNDNGDHLFHTALFNPLADVTKPSRDEAAVGPLVTWLTRYRPDLIAVPNHEGLDVLALGDRAFGVRGDWLPQRAQMEQAVLRGVAETVLDDPLPEARPRRRL